MNPSEKSPTFKLWDELYGGLISKRRQAFSPYRKKPRHSYRRGRGQIYRFVYERAKINNQKDTRGITFVYPKDFDPYHGCFLKDDLEEKVEKS